MKYVVTWKPRISGSALENEAGFARVLDVYSKWTMPSDSTFHQFVLRLDGEGGFAVVETDNPASIADGPYKFSPYLEYAVYPVVDVGEGVSLFSQGIEFRKSVK
jgi:hypothetical protein